MVFLSLGLGTLQDLSAQRLSSRADRAAEDLDVSLAHTLRRQAAGRHPGDEELQLKLASSSRGLWVFRDDLTLKAEADAAYLQASADSPHDPTPYYEHARMYSYKDRYEEALGFLAQALKLDPNNAGFHLERGRYLEALHQTATALQSYRTCSELAVVAECQEAIRRLRSP